MTVRRITDPTAERSLIETAMRSFFGDQKRLDMERFEDEWRNKSNTLLYVDDVTGKFIQADILPLSVQVVWWAPLHVTERADFLPCLPSMDGTLRGLRAEGVADTTDIWGYFRDIAIPTGLRTHLGPNLIVELGTEGPEHLPKVGNAFRGRITIGQLQQAISKLLSVATERER